MFSCTAGAAYIPYQNGSCSTSWKYKKNMMFDGSTGSGTYELDYPDRSWFLLAAPSAEFHADIGSMPVSIRLSKVFFIPVIPASFAADGSGSTPQSGSSGPDGSLIASWLLSGITLDASIRY